MTPEEPVPRSEAETLVEDFKVSATFMTRLPAAWLGAETVRPDFRRAARAFPLVGAMVGAVGGLVLVVAVWLHIPFLVTAALAVMATVIFTGALHEDGLADTVDGFGGGSDTVRKLEIMDDSRIGTFGVAAVVFSILLRVGVLASLLPHGAFRTALVLVAAEALSRGAVVRFWQELPAARLTGLAHETGPPDPNAAVTALVAGIVIAMALVWPAIGFGAAVLGILLAAVATYIFGRLSLREIGGRTGDTLGACQQIAAIAFLIGVAAAA
ncbi:MAG: adenosylcobinamide-GDP ribazoletransferase [Rhizobiales bacterium]|nr:adenosylcobinamide-GDP ribazoletransferase [Hyphomicrobiales bacterium]